MTREMNKTDWHNKWVKKDKGSDNNVYIEQKRVLNPDIAEFFYKTNERLK